MTLPDNVTPELINKVVASGVIIPSGTFSGSTLLPTDYTVATSTTPGTIHLSLVNVTPAGVTQLGDIATIVLNLANKAAPTASSFQLNNINIIDTKGNTLAGINAVVNSVVLK